MTPKNRDFHDISNFLEIDQELFGKLQQVSEMFEKHPGDEIRVNESFIKHKKTRKKKRQK